MKTGIELIAEERERQIKEEGWTPEHDDFHKNEELANAAVAYAIPDNRQIIKREIWPFACGWFKPNTYPRNKAGRIRELVKAGALIAAEIDRLSREIEKEK